MSNENQKPDTTQEAGDDWELPTQACPLNPGEGECEACQ